MILFKEIRSRLALKYPEREPTFVAMLSGAITNEVFGSTSPEERFIAFGRRHRSIIEQELLSLKEEHSRLMPALTDALRIQALCDHQQHELDSSTTLTRASEMGLLVADRPVPMPSTFMTMVRGLGERHGLVIAPVPIAPEQDQTTVH